jgi:hypothetical protein
MMHDANLSIFSTTTNALTSATALPTGGLNLGKGTFRGKYAAFVEIKYSGASVASGTGTLKLDLQYSNDGGTTWYLTTSGADQAVALSTTAVKGIIRLPLVIDTAGLVDASGNGISALVRILPTLTGTTPVANIDTAYVGLTKP